MGSFGHEGLAASRPVGVLIRPVHVGKDELAQEAVPLTAPGFLRQRIFPLAGSAASCTEEDWSAQVVQNSGTGRLTLRYAFGPRTVLLAKLYTDELGARCYAGMRALWESGFGRGSRYQVPEPVGFLADHNLLVMRQVPGKPVAVALEADTSVDLVAGSREAARWLGTLHRSPLRIGAPETDWSALKLFRMAARLIKAAAAQPEQLDMVRELLDALEARIRALPEGRRLVQTHGRYHHDHVFIAPEVVSVIDLDRCAPSDSGKDVAEFIRVLRLTAFKRGVDMQQADAATRAFLEEYLARLPEAAETLGCYWATFMFHSLLGGLKKSRNKEKRNWQELMDFYVAEMNRALEFGR